MIYVLELRSTEDYADVRYREYTSSARRAEKFRSIPKIQFSDSAHGIVSYVREHPRGTKREPDVRLLAAYVREHTK